LSRSQAFQSMRASCLACALAMLYLALSASWTPSRAADAGEDVRDRLRQLSLQHDFHLWMAPGLEPRSIAVEIESLPLAKALERLLRDYSYALVEGDAGEIRAVYVLPPGEDPPASLQIGYRDSEQMLARVLETDGLPEEIKSALLYQAITNNAPSRQSIRAQRAAAIEQLIELVDRDPGAQTDGMRLLREKLEAARDTAPVE